MNYNTVDLHSLKDGPHERRVDFGPGEAGGTPEPVSLLASSHLNSSVLYWHKKYSSQRKRSRFSKQTPSACMCQFQSLENCFFLQIIIICSADPPPQSEY